MPDTQQQLPEWLRTEPDGPHRRVGGLDRDTGDYDWRCARDGESWPCPTEQQRGTSR